jgi:hypothetical protein
MPGSEGHQEGHQEGQALKQGETFIPFKTNEASQKIHPSCLSLMTFICYDLNCFIFETREHGIQVSTHMVLELINHLTLGIFTTLSMTEMAVHEVVVFSARNECHNCWRMDEHLL